MNGRSSVDDGRPAGAPGRGHRSFIRLAAVVARRDYLRTVRRRGFVFGTAMLPAAIAGFAILSTLSAPRLEPPTSTAVTVVNESALEIRAPAGVPVRVVERQAAEAALAEGTLHEFYVVPADYPSSGRVQRISQPGGVAAIEDLARRAGQEQALAAALRASLLAGTDLAPAVLDRLLEPYVVQDVAADGTPARPQPAAGLGFLLPYAVTFLFVISIFITSGYLLQSVTEEKENRVVEIILSSVPPKPLMAGKIIGLGAAGLTQVALWIATGLAALPLLVERTPILAGLSVSPVVLALAVLFFVLGYLAYGAIFAAIGAVAPGTREAQQYSGFFGFFAVIPLIFAGAFLADPGSPLVVALALIPLTAPAAMLQLLAIAPEPPWGLTVASLASLAGFAVLAGVAASRVFRATILLYGARPSVRSVVGAMTARG